MDPGAPPTEMELQQILHNVRNNTNKMAVQPSSHNKPEPALPGLPLNITHVYTRQHKAVGLQSPYEGPFLIVDRPSRSTVKLEVGQFKSGEKRYEIRHLNDIKAAHPKSLAAPAQRPVLGRPSNKTSARLEGHRTTEPQSDTKPGNRSGSLPAETSEPASLPAVEDKENKQTLPAAVGNTTSVTHETSNPKNQEPPSNGRGRPVRSTRNKNPIYVDSLATDFTGPPAGHPFPKRWWSASKDELLELNSSISRGCYEK